MAKNELSSNSPPYRSFLYSCREMQRRTSSPPPTWTDGLAGEIDSLVERLFGSDDSATHQYSEHTEPRVSIRTWGTLAAVVRMLSLHDAPPPDRGQSPYTVPYHQIQRSAKIDGAGEINKDLVRPDFRIWRG